MDKRFWSVSLIALGLMSATQVSLGDDDDSVFRRPDVAPVTNALYTKECGGCHFTYPAGFLPEASWQKIMAKLEDHFGDDASLDETDHAELLAHLTSNSADKSNAKRSQKIMRSLGDRTPLRITGTAYFISKHDEVPPRLVHGNDQVRSFSNCGACHSRAAQGSFSEREIRIAGYGKWDD